MTKRPTMKTMIVSAARALVVAGLLALPAGQAGAAGEAPKPPAQQWSFDGIFGTWDLASLQRGFQVYKEVCAACHGMRLLSYRNLADIGFSEDEVRAIAAQYFITDGPDEFGDMFEREGRPSDRFASPFPNEQAARAANNGAYPKDLSVIAKARAGGPDYLHALLTGYREPPADTEMSPGMFYNEYFPGHQMAMPEVLFEESVSYADGSPMTVEQYAYDVSNFLMWAAEPTLEERKRMGIKVILFLIVFTALMYAVKRKVWADVH